MMASRGMGAILPSKMPGGKRKQRRDDTDFTQYAEGGLLPESPGSLAGTHSTELDSSLATAKKKAQLRKDVSAVKSIESEQQLRQRLRGYADGGEVKSKVNEAGNYTKPEMRKALFNRIKGQATQGTAAGQWSARKAQLLAKQYKAKGGGYRG